MVSAPEIGALVDVVVDALVDTLVAGSSVVIIGIGSDARDIFNKFVTGFSFATWQPPFLPRGSHLFASTWQQHVREKLDSMNAYMNS
jgi:hypothetical protein